MDLSNLRIHYKYTTTMQIETNTMEHIINRWETVHIFEFMEGKHIEFHLSPEYIYNGTKYYQITLDLDLEKFHKREGTGLKGMLETLNIIKSKLTRIPYVIEFTGNGYRIATLSVWKDLDLNEARSIAMNNKSVLPAVDPVSSFRTMPIARIGTLNPGRRLIVAVSKRDSDNFSKYKTLSKKLPITIHGKAAWLELFKQHWVPTKFLSSGGMDIIKKLYERG